MRYYITAHGCHLNKKIMFNATLGLYASEGECIVYHKPYIGTNTELNVEKFCSKSINKKLKHIGVFSSPQDAHNAYLIAKRQFHKGCTI